MLNLKTRSFYIGQFSFRVLTYLGLENFITTENKMTLLPLIKNMKPFFSELYNIKWIKLQKRSQNQKLVF